MKPEVRASLATNESLKRLLGERARLTRIYGSISLGLLVGFCVVLVYFPALLGVIIPGTSFLSVGMILSFVVLTTPVFLSLVYARYANGPLAELQREVLKDIRDE